MQNTNQMTIDKILIFIIGLLIFTIGLNPEFIAFQTRFALFAQNMFFHGITAFPTTYQGPYPDYPALSTIMIYMVAKIFGQVTPFTAILPTAIVSAFILVLTYQIGSLHSRSWGWLGVGFALFAEYFFTASRSISPDQYTSLATALCFYLIYTADLYNTHKRLWFIPLILILSFAFRGPIGLVIPTGVICGYFLCNKEWLKLFSWAGIALILLILSCTVLFYAAYHQGGIAFVKNVLIMEAIGRMDEHAKTYSFFFYWYDSLITYAVTFPFALVVIISSIKRILKPQTAPDKLLQYLTVWLLIILLGMSIPGAKRARYILAIIPAISLVAASIFTIPDTQKAMAWLRKIFIGFCYILPLLALILVTTLYYVNKTYNYHLQAYYVSSIFLTFIATILVWFIHMRTKNHAKKTYMIYGIALLTFIFCNISILDPINYAVERTQPFVQAVKTLQAQTNLPFIFYKIGPDAEDIKFMVNLNEPIKPQFIQQKSALLNYPKPAYFIALSDDFNKLPKTNQIKILYQGKIGHRKSVIFILQ